MVNIATTSLPTCMGNSVFFYILPKSFKETLQLHDRQKKSTEILFPIRVDNVRFQIKNSTVAIFGQKV